MSRTRGNLIKNDRRHYNLPEDTNTSQAARLTGGRLKRLHHTTSADASDHELSFELDAQSGTITPTANAQFRHLDHANQDSASNHNNSFNLNDLESDTDSIPTAAKPLKRLRRANHIPTNDFVDLAETEDSSEESYTSVDSPETNNEDDSQEESISVNPPETDDEDDLNEEQGKKLNKYDWVFRVINHLIPLTPVYRRPPPVLIPKIQFLNLKEQWGYTGHYEAVDANKTDCTLCSHERVASLFTIMNIYNKIETKAASNCIMQFDALNPAGLFYDRKASKAIIQADINSANAAHVTRRSEINKLIRR